MSFLVTSRCDEEIEMVWQGDPAIKSDGRDVVPMSGAKTKKGKTPDRFVVRALNNREVFSVSAYGNESSVGLALAAVEICLMATVRIHTADGKIIKDTDQIRAMIDASAPPEFVGSLATAIYGLTVGSSIDGADSSDVPLGQSSGVTVT